MKRLLGNINNSLILIMLWIVIVVGFLFHFEKVEEVIGESNMTGMVFLQPDEQSQIETVVIQYLMTTKQWKQDEFRIEYKKIDDNGNLVVVWAIHVDDERNPIPGAGKSAELHINRKQQQVVREQGFQ